VHTVGFGKEELTHDIEMEDVSVAANATANARIVTTVSLMQHGYAGRRRRSQCAMETKTVAEREITLGRTDASRPSRCLSHSARERKA